MLILTRKNNESIIINNNIEIKVLTIKRGQVSLGFYAPREVSIHRKEIYDAIQQENIHVSQGRQEKMEQIKTLKERLFDNAGESDAEGGIKPEDIVPDFNEWPEQWKTKKKDLAYGKSIADGMRLFIEDLISKGISESTIKKHMDNLQMLGEEIIADVSTANDYDTPPLMKLIESSDPEEAPYCRNLNSEAEIKAFDITCKKLHKFMQSTI
jgi:carbon storage regulator